jgi:hypothetical protein
MSAKTALACPPPVNIVEQLKRKINPALSEPKDGARSDRRYPGHRFDLAIGL